MTAHRKRYSPFLLVALSSIGFATASNFSLPALADSIADADQYLVEDKFKQAEEGYRSLIDDDTTGDAYAGLAVALAKQGIPAKIAEAEKTLRQAKDKFPDNPNVLAAAGYVSYMHAKNVASPAKRDLYLDAAETLCNRAIKVNPDILIAQNTLGLAKLAQDELVEAIGPLQKACELSESPNNLTTLAMALIKIDPKDKEASENIEKAISLKPDFQPAHLQKANILLAQGRGEDAFSELHNIPNQYRTSDWYLTEGDIYKKQGDGPSALNSWSESIHQDPHSPDAYRKKAEYYMLRGDGQQAISEMHNALEILPNDMALRTQLAELALRQDNLDVAETEYKTIMSSQPDDPNALLGLARVNFRKARRDGQYPPGHQQLMEQLSGLLAEKTVTGSVIKDQASHLQENMRLSDAEKALTNSHFKEARQLFSNVIGTHKDDAYQLITLGEQAFNDGDLRSAEEAFNYAKLIPEVTSRAEQWLSKIATQQNDAVRQTKLGDATQSKLPAVAIDYYRQALIADPQFPDAYYGLYSIFTRNRPDTDRAIKNAVCFLETSEDSNPLRREVESGLEKLRKRAEREKNK